MANLVMDYQVHGAIIAALEPFRGHSDWLKVSKLTVESFETEEFLVLTAHTDGGQFLDREPCGKLMDLPAHIVDGQTPVSAPLALAPLREAPVAGYLQSVDARNALDRQRDELIGKIERQLNKRHSMQPLFMAWWEIKEELCDSM